METLKENKILEFNPNQLLEVRKCYGYDDLNKLYQDLDHFEDWIRQQNHFKVKKFDRGYLERFLIYNKGSIENAKQRFEKLCAFNNLMLDLLQNFDIKNEFIHIQAISFHCVLPKPTPDNYRVIITDMTGEENDEWTLLQYYRYTVVVLIYLLHNDYCIGFECIVNPRHVNFNMLKKINPMIIHKALTLMVGAIGHRLKRLHFISGSSFFETIISIYKKAITPKLAQRLVIHRDVESLYDYIPQKLLPKDYGGEQKSIKELNDMNFKEFCTDQHMRTMENFGQAGTNEDLRLTYKFNEEYSGLPGSFKNLCVD